MLTLLTTVHIVACVILVLVVLIQSGKGAEISASLGGSSQTVFGSSGGANFFTRFTSVLAGIFMLTSVGLTVVKAQSRKSLFEGQSPIPAANMPANPFKTGTPAGGTNTAPPNSQAAPGAQTNAEPPQHTGSGDTTPKGEAPKKD